MIEILPLLSIAFHLLGYLHVTLCQVTVSVLAKMVIDNAMSSESRVDPSADSGPRDATAKRCLDANGWFETGGAPRLDLVWRGHLEVSRARVALPQRLRQRGFAER